MGDLTDIINRQLDGWADAGIQRWPTPKTPRQKFVDDYCEREFSRMSAAGVPVTNARRAEVRRYANDAFDRVDKH